ncbi:hypothetical protein BpHYR1_038491 [Brachionus plicatilis]|uniref:Uncharacterized protein n=1 Tax=Brachionus plicatilis TaxID=10195 RepID=A0A3M7R9P2_BRAPC|nr:hypothetical protein BpHYR1_038491 [Brachionus plicatilis]
MKHQTPLWNCYICATFVLHLCYICATFVLHLCYICDLFPQDSNILTYRPVKTMKSLDQIVKITNLKNIRLNDFKASIWIQLSFTISKIPLVTYTRQRIMSMFYFDYLSQDSSSICASILSLSGLKIENKTKNISTQLLCIQLIKKISYSMKTYIV